MELLKRINYKAKKFGLHPSEYAIAQNKKYGVQKEIESLKNWMTNNRHKFTDKDRTSKVEPGKGSARFGHGRGFARNIFPPALCSLLTGVSLSAISHFADEKILRQKLRSTYKEQNFCSDEDEECRNTIVFQMTRQVPAEILPL